MKEKIKKTLIDLVKISSVSNNFEELEKISNYIINFFKNNKNAIIKTYKFNNVPSVVIANEDTTSFDIILNGHFDVVPPSEDKQFEAYEENGKLFARGAADMKSGDAIIMHVMKTLLEKNFTKKKIALILTGDEEVGGFNGVNKLVNDLGYFGKVVLIPDGGNTETVIYAEKGIIQLECEFYGINAHSSRPWLGKNAIDNLFKFYNLLKNYVENQDKLYHTNSHRGTSANVNVINGGTATNILADKVTAKVDIRFTEEFEEEKLVKLLEEFVKRCNGKITKKLVGSLLYKDPYSTEIQEYLRLNKKIIPDLKLDKYPGACDGRYFAKKGSTVLIHKATSGNEHSKKERVQIDDLEIVYQAYLNYIENSSI